jgi:hypothetical protein
MLSVYTDDIIDGIYRIKKKRFDDVEIFAGDFSDRITEGCKPGSPYSDVTNSSSAFDGITNRSIPSVIPSVKVNISPLYQPSPPLFLLLLPHRNSPLPNCKQQPRPPKNIPLFSTQVIFL